MIPLWKKIVSWFYPINIEKVVSTVSGELEVNLQYGNLVIDTKLANYSFGNLHLVFQEAILRLHLNTSKKYNVLILGFGAGSIANILINENGLNCNIVGIELDSSIIALSKKYIPSNIFNYSEIIVTDAFKYMETNSEQFDLIFVDLFINTTIPKQFQSQEFLDNIKKALRTKSQLLMNSMSDSEELHINWNKVFGQIEKISIQDNNVLIFKDYATSISS